MKKKTPHTLDINSSETIFPSINITVILLPVATGCRRRQHNRGEYGLKTFFDVLFTLTVRTGETKYWAKCQTRGLFSASPGNSKPNVIISPPTAIKWKQTLGQHCSLACQNFFNSLFSRRWKKPSAKKSVSQSCWFNLNYDCILIENTKKVNSCIFKFNRKS